jgi:hypothetical protein
MRFSQILYNFGFVTQAGKMWEDEYPKHPSEIIERVDEAMKEIFSIVVPIKGTDDASKA